MRLAAAHDAEQLLVAHFLAAEFGHVARDDEVRALDVLALFLEVGFLLELGHVVAVEDVETVGRLQMRNQDRFRLAAQAIDAIGKDAAHEAGTVIELADSDQGTWTNVRSGRAGDCGNSHGLRRFGSAASQRRTNQRCNQQRARFILVHSALKIWRIRSNPQN
ncbi:hypothetical protein D3C81_1449570 [compost metagenome]